MHAVPVTVDPTTPHSFTGEELLGLLRAGAPPRFLRRLLELYPSRDAWLAAPLLDGEEAPWRSAPAEAFDGTLLVLHTAQYPALLAAAPAPPPVLLVRGTPTALRAGVGVVGPRDCSDLGVIVATIAAETAFELGAPVISGLARGVDAVAHDVALANGVETVAFLGTGIDLHEDQDRIARICDAGGAVCSETIPGVPSSPQQLQARNRLIAALATPLVIAEGRDRSGTAGTARAALRQRRAVVVPQPKPSHRNLPTAALLHTLALPPAAAAERLGLRPDVLSSSSTTASTANAVCEDRATLRDAIRVFYWLGR